MRSCRLRRGLKKFKLSMIHQKLVTKISKELGVDISTTDFVNIKKSVDSSIQKKSAKPTLEENVKTVAVKIDILEHVNIIKDKLDVEERKGVIFPMMHLYVKLQPKKRLVILNVLDVNTTGRKVNLW